MPRGEGTVLFVDDETTIVSFAKPLLEGLGYHVLAHIDSREALKVFRSKPNIFDIIITDQTMPHCTGEMLAQEILTIRPDIPIILCSGFSHVMTEEKTLSMGIRAFLLKPFSTEDLAQTIQRILARETNQKEGPTAQSTLPVK